MSFIYPRLATITRPVSGGGAVGIRTNYSGVVTASETTIATGIKCSIQFKTTGNAPLQSLAADIRARTQWRVFMPTVALGVIQDRDIVTDDLGQRYQVNANYWNSLGYNLYCERLEA